MKETAQKLLPGLREVLGPKAKDVSDKSLLKFLHWKPDIKRASERFNSHMTWRKKNPFFFDDDPPLSPSKDPVLKRVLESEVIVAPEGFVDQAGNTVLVGRLRNNDMGDGRTPKDVCRMAIYIMDRILEDENTQINGVTVFHDLEGMSPKNMDPGIPKMLFSAIIGNLPLRIKGIYILNAPFFFSTFFKVLSLGFPSKLRQRIHFVKDKKDIPIDQENFLVEHGGKREHDSKAWVQSQINRESKGVMDSLGKIPILS